MTELFADELQDPEARAKQLGAHPSLGSGTLGPSKSGHSLAVPGCASEVERWTWHQRLPSVPRFVALGSALALGSLPQRGGGLGLAWWSLEGRAEVSLLFKDGPLLRELLHLPTPNRAVAWEDILLTLGVNPKEIAWWVGSASEAPPPLEPLAKLLPHAKVRWHPLQRAEAGLEALDGGRLALIPSLGCHVRLLQPYTSWEPLLAGQSRPLRLQGAWKMPPAPLAAAHLLCQSPCATKSSAQSWWWCALSASGELPSSPPPAWLFPESGLPAQVPLFHRLPGEGLWIRCDGSEAAQTMRRHLLEAQQRSQAEALRLAHLGAHALWAVAEGGPSAWPRVHAAWGELLG